MGVTLEELQLFYLTIFHSFENKNLEQIWTRKHQEKKFDLCLNIYFIEDEINDLVIIVLLETIEWWETQLIVLCHDKG